MLIDVRMDGYVNASKLCRDMGKVFAAYWRTVSAKKFASALSVLERLDVLETDGVVTTHTTLTPQYLVYFGDGKTTSTWVHPDIGTVIDTTFV